MKNTKLIYVAGLLTTVAACGGGGGGGGPTVTDGPVSGAEVASVFDGIAEIGGGGLGTDLTMIDPGDIDLTDITPLDVTVGGSASYDGIVLIADANTSGFFASDPDLSAAAEELFESDGSFVILGRSTMDVTFGADPEISGGANGFIGLNSDAEIALDETDLPAEPTEADVVAFINSLPTIDVDGSLTYSNASVFDLSGLGVDDLPNGLGFDVDGNLVLTSALTGLEGTQNVTVDGQGIGIFTNTLSGALLDLGTTGGTTDLPLGGVAIGVAD